MALSRPILGSYHCRYSARVPFSYTPSPSRRTASRSASAAMSAATSEQSTARLTLGQASPTAHTTVFVPASAAATWSDLAGADSAGPASPICTPIRQRLTMAASMLDREGLSDLRATDRGDGWGIRDSFFRAP